MQLHTALLNAIGKLKTTEMISGLEIDRMTKSNLIILETSLWSWIEQSRDEIYLKYMTGHGSLKNIDGDCPIEHLEDKEAKQTRTNFLKSEAFGSADVTRNLELLIEVRKEIMMDSESFSEFKKKLLLI